MGQFVVHIHSSAPSVVEGIGLMYGDFPLAFDQPFADFHVAVTPPAGVRRWIRPQILFSHDGYVPFKPLPIQHGYALLEWGLNWCVSRNAFQYLSIHAGVIERGGRAAILPAPPGSGKSTLCAALVQRHWRLLSDELALVTRHNGALVPIARPVNLKNQSIDIIRDFEPSAVVGEPAFDTSKGTVAHMRPPSDSVARINEIAWPAWVIFPKYVPGSSAQMKRMPKGEAFMQLAASAFNYGQLGQEGFRVLTEVINRCDCYSFTYSRLDEAVETFRTLEPPPSKICE